MDKYSKVNAKNSETQDLDDYQDLNNNNSVGHNDPHSHTDDKDNKNTLQGP